MNNNEIIGVARTSIETGATVVEINLATGKVTSKNLSFRPWGKKKLWEKITKNLWINRK